MPEDCSPDAVSGWMIENFKHDHGYREPFKVLISTILSQRTRDENTDEASRKLFSVFPTMESIAAARPEELYELIKQSGMYRQKAERIVNCAEILLERFGGRVPDTIEELTSIPGVGRKTANIVLNISFGKEALAVDTHVHRISNRLGWVKTKSPEETEFALMKIISPHLWGPVNGSMVEFGRQICRPVGPRCEDCAISRCCDYYGRISKEDIPQ